MKKPYTKKIFKFFERKEQLKYTDILNLMGKSKIGKRIGLTFLIIIILSGLLGFIAIKDFKNSSIIINEVYDHPFIVSNNCNSINYNIIEIQGSLKYLLLSKDVNRKKNILEKISRCEEDIEAQYQIVFERFLGEKQQINEAYLLYKNWKPIREEFLRLIEENNNETAAEILINESRKHIDVLIGKNKAIIEYAYSKADSFIKRAEKNRIFSYRSVSILVILVIFVSISLAILTTKSITIPLRRFLEAVISVSHGNLDVHTQIRRNDEIGVLSKAFDQMCKDLKNSTVSISQLETVNQQLAASEQQLKAVNQQLMANEQQLRAANQQLVADEQQLKAANQQLTASEKQLRHLNEQMRQNEKNLIIAKEKTEKLNKELTLEKLYAIEMQSKAEAANMAKSEFLANMSHEIRTPMNAIIGLTELMADEQLEERHKETLNVISECSHNLLSLINDILDFSKIEAGELGIDKIDFSMQSFLASIKNITCPKAQSKNIKFEIINEVKLPQAINTDPDRLKQCLINLTDNAIKFTSNGCVNLYVSTIKKDNKNFLRFRVEDTGIGIPKAKQDIIFESFKQADGSTTRKYGGTGLGLTITKKITNLLGGTIDLESKEGKGSKFTLLIPFGSVSNAISSKFTDQAIDTVKFNGKALLAEDTITNQLVMHRLLEKFGLNVYVANDGLEAFNSALENNFDIIFMDMQMPNMNGYEATQKIKSSGIKNPIIAVTANAMEGDERACIEAGCDDYISKPVNRNKLKHILERYIANKQ